MKKIINFIKERFSFLSMFVFLFIVIIITIGIKETKNISEEMKRDQERISTLLFLDLGLVHYNTLNSKYPINIKDSFQGELPKDPKDGKTINGCIFGYKYELFEVNGIKNSGYRLSTCLENLNNIEKKAKNDGGIYDNKFELFSK